MMTEASINFNGSHNNVIVGHMKVESEASTPPPNSHLLESKCFEYCIHSWIKKHNGATYICS